MSPALGNLVLKGTDQGNNEYRHIHADNDAPEFGGSRLEVLFRICILIFFMEGLRRL